MNMGKNIKKFIINSSIIVFMSIFSKMSHASTSDFHGVWGAFLNENDRKNIECFESRFFFVFGPDVIGVFNRNEGQDISDAINNNPKERYADKYIYQSERSQFVLGGEKQGYLSLIKITIDGEDQFTIHSVYDLDKSRGELVRTSNLKLFLQKCA